MSLGNAFGLSIKADNNDLFGGAPGSIVVESEKELDYENAILLGNVTSGEDGKLHINGKSVDIFELMEANQIPFASIYPLVSKPDFKRILPKGMEGVKPKKAKKVDLKYKGEKVDEPIVFIPVYKL